MKCTPVHRVTVSSCEMSRNEVTVEQYQVFLDATGHSEPPEWETQTNHPERPVVFVSWGDANAFADWAEARLPTEAEWEYSARGGLEGELYPWGSDEPDAHANFGHEWEKGNGWISSLTRPGSFSPNKFGLNDMSGNVWEWCHDWFGPYSEGTIVNPTGPEAGEKRVVRGGAWNSTSTTIRTSVRGPQDPQFKGPHTGFRIVRDVRS
jgi:formylglycine-generating enzyme required for sulfatase activity